MTIPSTFHVLHFSIGRVLPLDLAALVEEGVVSGLAMAAELSPAPEFREISRIREFSENSTEKLPKSSRNFKK